MEKDLSWDQSTVCSVYKDIPGRKDWESLYPTVKDVLFADISQCPPHLRHHFELELLDADFELPSQPYLYMQHKTFVKKCLHDDADSFHGLMEEYVKGPGGQYWCAAGPRTEEAHVAPMDLYWTKKCALTGPPVTTARPELGACGGAGVSLTFHNVTPKTATNHPLLQSGSTDETDRHPSKKTGFQVFATNLESCRSWIQLERRFISVLLDSAFQSATNKPLMDLEDSLFDMATYPKCCDGVFYMSAFQIGTFIYMRFLESGAYRRVFPVVKLKMRECFPEESTLTWWQVYSAFDIVEASARNQADALKKPKKSDGRGYREDKAYQRLLTSNAHSVMSSLAKLSQVEASDDAKFLGAIVHTHYKGHQQLLGQDVDDKWYLNCSGVFADFSTRVEALLKDFRTQAVVPNSQQDHFSLISHLFPAQMSLGEQCDAVSLLPNLDQVGKPRRYSQRFSVTPKGSPLSPRNIVLWAFAHRERHPQMVNCFNGLFCNNCPEPSSSFEDTDSIDIQPQTMSIASARGSVFNINRQRYTAERLRRSVELCDRSSGAANMSAGSLTLYENYKTRLVEQGTVHWRIQSSILDTFVLNNYCSETGAFKPTDYVHCSRTLTETGYRYACDCSVYRAIEQQCESESLDMDNSDVTCLHCRLLKEVFPLDSFQVVSQEISKLESLFVKAKESVGKSFVICSGARGTSKFCVQIDGVCCFVHLTYNACNKRYRISCQSGRCQMIRGAKRTVSFLNKGDLCPHLSILRDEISCWQHLLVESEEDAESSDGESGVEFEDSEDSSAPPLQEKTPSSSSETSFDVITGKWKFPCLSQHSAQTDGCEHLAKAIQARDKIADSNPDCTPRDGGCLKGPDMFPPVPTTPCACTAGWTSEEQPDGRLEYVRSMNLYTLQAPATCKVFRRVCIGGICRILWDEGKSECLHVSSTDTCAGDEIGYLFLDRVLSGRQSFTGFCTEMTNLYKRRCGNSRQFMSPNVFIKWWFSWAANQDKEFKKPCPVCKYQPKVLGCDGTKIGITFRHTNVTPIEKPDRGEVIETLHRRNDRCFLNYTEGHAPEQMRKARQNMLYMSQYICGKVQGALTNDALVELYNQVKLCLPQECCPAFARLCIVEGVADSEKMALGRIFGLLATTAPVSVLLPCRYVGDLERLLNVVTGVGAAVQDTNALCNKLLSEMRGYSPELRELFAASAFHNLDKPACPHYDVVVLLKYLIMRVRTLHDQSIPPEPANPQPGTYNPPKYGRAYYFSESGCKLRNIRKFTMDEERKGSNYDDAPADHERCTKIFPDVGRKGTSYLFLWFCPVHGHCYGFHIIPGSEGRKDPSASLYSHLEVPPLDIFYDFACNLQEYCLNRESGYYMSVRFFHDIFHGFTHKCSECYKSSRLVGFEPVNSEIAEQFNSYIQCIKYPARQMSQVHFVFFLQYFIDIWNTKKAKKHQQQLCVAAAGTL